MRVILAAWAALIQLLVFSHASLASDHSSKSTADHPNIVVLMVEDLSPRIGAFGDDLARTPNIDRLAREGIRFTNVFTTAGVCAPSRAAFITGMYQQTMGGQHMRTSSFDRITDGGISYETVPPPYVKAFPEYLRAAGYVTINNHKTDYQFGNPTSVWDANSTQAGLADRDPSRPFFMMVSDNTSHESGLFVDGQVPRPGSTSPQFLKDSMVNRAAQTAQYLAQMSERTDPASVTVPPYLPDTALIRQEIAQHYDNISRLDDNIGKILNALESEGLMDNTIIIWTTDHGDGIARGKRTLYDSGLHVPMIIRYPDQRDAGSVREELISFVDLAPTILSLAGLPSPEYVHGRNFLSGNSALRDYIYAARDRLDEFPDRSRAVRDTRFKYIRNYDVGRPLFQPLDYRENLLAMQEMRRLLASGALPPQIAAYFQTPRPLVELFDTHADPHEINNLAGNPQYAQVQERLAGELDAFLAQHRDYGDTRERVMVREFMWPGGIQPQTLAPEGTVTLNDAGEHILTISSETHGASIEYRLPKSEQGADRWWLYSGPIAVSAKAQVEARAIRYGFKPSETVAINP